MKNFEESRNGSFYEAGARQRAKYLLDEGIKTIFCATEYNSYPHGIYKKIGFKDVFTTQIYYKDQNKNKPSSID